MKFIQRNRFSPVQDEQVKYRYFTLIELLVVIAIIAILAAILMPALSQARERGKSTTCANNLKAIANAFGAYSDAYNDCITPVSGIWAKGAYGYSRMRWQHGIVRLGFLPSNSWDMTSDSPHSVRGMHTCPSETTTFIGTSSIWNTWKGSQYGMANYTGVTYSTTSRSRYFETRGQLKMPSRQARAGDKAARSDKDTFGMTYEILTENSDGNAPGAMRHLDKINVAFFDQHVESRTINDVPNDIIHGENYWKCAFWSRKDQSKYWGIYPW